MKMFYLIPVGKKIAKVQYVKNEPYISDKVITYLNNFMGYGTRRLCHIHK